MANQKKDEKCQSWELTSFRASNSGDQLDGTAAQLEAKRIKRRLVQLKRQT